MALSSTYVANFVTEWDNKRKNVVWIKTLKWPCWCVCISYASGAQRPVLLLRPFTQRFRPESSRSWL